MVPRERCAVVTSGGGAGPRCRAQSRLVCEDTPRQKCGTKVGGYIVNMITLYDMMCVAGADPVPAGAHPEVFRREAGEVRHAVRHRLLVQDV